MSKRKDYGLKTHAIGKFDLTGMKEKHQRGRVYLRDLALDVSWRGDKAKPPLACFSRLPYLKKTQLGVSANIRDCEVAGQVAGAARIFGYPRYVGGGFSFSQGKFLGVEGLRIGIEGKVFHEHVDDEDDEAEKEEEADGRVAKVKPELRLVGHYNTDLVNVKTEFELNERWSSTKAMAVLYRRATNTTTTTPQQPQQKETWRNTRAREREVVVGTQLDFFADRVFSPRHLSSWQERLDNLELKNLTLAHILTVPGTPLREVHALSMKDLGNDRSFSMSFLTRHRDRLTVALDTKFSPWADNSMKPEVTLGVLKECKLATFPHKLSNHDFICIKGGESNFKARVSSSGKVAFAYGNGNVKSWALAGTRHQSLKLDVVSEADLASWYQKGENTARLGVTVKFC